MYVRTYENINEDSLLIKRNDLLNCMIFEIQNTEASILILIFLDTTNNYLYLEILKLLSIVNTQLYTF